MVRIDDAAGHVFACRHSAHGGFLRQVRGDRGSDRRGTGVVGGDRGADVAHRRVLLPAHRQAHVFRRGSGPDAA